jgi:HEAT repeat protein
MNQQLRHRLRSLRSICLLAAALTCGTALLRAAAPYGTDPVEELKKALKTKDTDPKERQKLIDMRVSNLRVNDYLRALSLIEWRVSDTDAVDQVSRQKLINAMVVRFEEIFKSGSTAAKLAAITEIAEMGIGIRAGNLPEELDKRERDLVKKYQDKDNQFKDDYKKLEDASKALEGDAKKDKELAELKKKMTNLKRTQKRELASMREKEGLDIVTVVDTISLKEADRWRRGGLARQFTPNLVALCSDGDSVVRQFAARALGKINPDPEPATEALSKLLKTGNVAERRAAADGLFNMLQSLSRINTGKRPPGASIDVTIPPVDKAFTDLFVVPAAGLGAADSDTTVRMTCLEAIRLGAGTIVDLIILPISESDLSSSSSLETDRSLMRALEPVVGELAKQVPVVVQRLDDPVAEIRLVACHTMEEMAQARGKLLRKAASLPAIENGSGSDPTPQGRQPRQKPAIIQTAAALPVAQAKKADDAANSDPLGKPLEDSLGALAARATTDTRVHVRLAAIDAIEPLSREAASTVPTLARALQDPNNFVRWASSRVIGKIGPVNPELTVPLLARLLIDPDLDVELSAANALGIYGPAAAPAVPALTAAVGAGDAERRVAAIHALQGIGKEDSKPAIPALTSALAHADPRVREAAAEGLGLFGRDARSATAALEQALTDVEPVRKAAAGALLAIAAEK